MNILDRLNDPATQAERIAAKADAWASRRPKCDECLKPIQEDSAIHFGSFWICERCQQKLTEYIPDEE